MKTRSKKIDGCVEHSSPSTLKFPFFDMESEANASRDYMSTGSDLFTPPATRRRTEASRINETLSSSTSDWDAEISPIAKSRESDSGGGVIHVPSDDPTGVSEKNTSNNEESPNDDLSDMISNLQKMVEKDLFGANSSEHTGGISISDLSQRRESAQTASFDNTQPTSLSSISKDLQTDNQGNSLIETNDDQIQTPSRNANHGFGEHDSVSLCSTSYLFVCLQSSL